MRITYDNVDDDGDDDDDDDDADDDDADDEDEVENVADDDVEDDNVAEDEVEEDNGGKVPRPEPRPKVCAGLRSRNAHRHVIRAIYTDIYRNNAAAQSEHPDQAPTFTTTVRTRQCGHRAHWACCLISLSISLTSRSDPHQ